MSLNLDEKVVLWNARFYGRRDVFGEKAKYFSQKENMMVSRYSPVYKKEFRSKQSREGAVFQSPSELYEEFNKDAIVSHINGTVELLIYILHKDGTCKFAAIDFDDQHCWEDVMVVSSLLTELHIPHGIARSTNKGWHIYLFFDRMIEAKFVTSFINFLFAKVGFHDRLTNGEMGQKDKPWSNPEVFPKTINFGDALSTGYGIKPPMHGAGMEKDRNCWVDENDEPIGGSGKSPLQWSYFQQIPLIDVEDFMFLIQEEKIHVDYIRMSERRGPVRQREYKRVTDYKAPEDGDFMQIINGCPAFKRIWNASNAEMSHEARVAMLSLALKTRNGIEILRDRFGHSEVAEKQIQYAIETSQNPWSCLALQSYGVCIKGKDPVKTSGNSKDANGVPLLDYCLEKVPPRETINGKVVINAHNVSEEEWPQPSPVRLRVPKKTINNSVLKSEIAAVNKKESHKSKIDEKESEVDNNTDFRVVNGKRYTTIEGGGYATVQVGPDREYNLTTIANFEVFFKEDVTKFTVMGEKIRNFIGHITCKGRKIPFSVPANEWDSNAKMAVILRDAIGMDAAFDVNNLGKVRDAVHAFGSIGMNRRETFEDYGFDDVKNPTVYRSAKFNIAASDFISDSDLVVDLSEGMEAKHLSLEPISKEDFANTVHVIKTDLLKIQDKIITFTVVAHSLQAAIHNVYIPFPGSPILWLQGVTGSGKSQIAKFAQNFHGNFDGLISIQSTARSIETYAMLFKDSLLVLDDYKQDFFRDGTIKLVQKIYDRSVRGRLGSNLKQSATTCARGLLMITAEDGPSSEASAISRTIYLESKELTSGKSKSELESFRRVESTQAKFNGVTGLFIQYMLKKYPDPKKVHSKFYEIADIFRSDIKDQQNSNRIANNLAANYVTWELFLEFLLSAEMLSKDEFSELREGHWQNINHLKQSMVAACTKEQASNVFLNGISELLGSGRFKIDGLINDRNPHAISLGYVESTNSTIINLRPKLSVLEVKRFSSSLGEPLSHSAESIGKQLFLDGYIVDTTKGHGPSLRKQFQGKREFVWALDGVKCGFVDGRFDVHAKGTKEQFLESLIQVDDPLEDFSFLENKRTH